MGYGHGVYYTRGNQALSGMRSMQEIQAGNQQLGANNRAADTEAGIDTAIRDWFNGRSALGQPAAAAAPAPAVAAPAPVAPPVPNPGASPTQPGPSVSGIDPAVRDRVNAFRSATSGIAPHVGLEMVQARAGSPGGSMMPQAPDYSSLTSRLAQVPGAGRLALQLKQGQDTAAVNLRSKSLDQAFAALKSGNIAAFTFWSGQAGVTWPDEVLKDEHSRVELARAGEWKKLYGNDLTGFGRFFQEAMTSAKATGQADYRRAFALHPPQRPASAAEISAGLGSPVMRDARILARARGIPLEQAYREVQQGHFRPSNAPSSVQLYNTRKEAWLKAHPGDDAGALTYAGGGGGRAGGGGHSVFELKQQAFLAVHPGDAQGALDYASGRKQMSEGDMRLAAMRIASGILKSGALPGSPPSTEDLMTTTQQIMEGLKAPSGGTTVGPGNGGDMATGGGYQDEDPEANAPSSSGSFGPDLTQYAHPETKEDYDALGSGDYFVDPDSGELMQKP